MQALSRQNPVLMIFEDAHWTDPTSLEAFGRVVDRLRTLRVLLIVTYRPEFEPPWIGRPHVTALTLNRFGAREIAAMIDGVTNNKPLPADIRRDIVERADGIPLFIEEMTKAVLEAESEDEARQTTAAVPASALAVPASLHASLMARLDRLGPAKEVAQIGAALGREFSHPLLAAVTRKPEAELQSALDRLVEAGLLFRQGASPQATYLFKHALVQDAAYGTLLREPRRALHCCIAETLETSFPEIAENQPEVLARHCTEAGLIEKAAGLWGKAGQRSIQRSALVEAVTQLNRALDQIATLPSTPALRRDEIKLQVALITPLMHVKGYAAPETKAVVERARLLIEQAEGLGEPQEDPLLLFSVLYGFWLASYVGFNGDALRELAAHFLTLAEKQTATGPLMLGHRLVGLSLQSTGDITQGLTHFDRALALYDPVEHASLSTRFGQDGMVSILSNRALALLLLGYPDRALTDADRAVEYARDAGQAASLMFALFHSLRVKLPRRNYEAALALADELFTLADEKSALFWKNCGVLGRGSAFALTGRAAEALETISSGLAALRTTGTTLWQPVNMLYLATAHAELGQFDEAWRCIAEAIGTIAKTKERWFEAEANRIAGEIALKSPERDASKAETYFERALAVARKQQAKFLELRAAMSMARLWRDQGKPQQARELLAPVYRWFTEGFDTRDLKEAKALLEELAA
jgi:predicted ATPase